MPHGEPEERTTDRGEHGQAAPLRVSIGRVHQRDGAGLPHVAIDVAHARVHRDNIRGHFGRGHDHRPGQFLVERLDGTLVPVGGMLLEHSEQALEVRARNDDVGALHGTSLGFRLTRPHDRLSPLSIEDTCRVRQAVSGEAGIAGAVSLRTGSHSGGSGWQISEVRSGIPLGSFNEVRCGGTSNEGQE